MKKINVCLPDLTKRYDIGKKPLAKLLGWGETTVMRYLNGQAEPNGEFLRRIEELSENPWEYLRLLEYNKDKGVLTEVAYRKTKAAAIKAILCDRATEAMQYVISLAEGDIAPSRVIAVLYYAQVCSLVFCNHPLFEEEATIAENLSVFPRLHEKMLQHGIHEIPMETSSLSEDERKYLNDIYETLNKYSPLTIAKAVPRDKERLLKSKNGETGAVAPMELKKYYMPVLKKYEVTKPTELGKFMKPKGPAGVKK